MRAMPAKISARIRGARAQRRLVQHHDGRLGQQRAADGQHLLLAARQVAGTVAPARFEQRKEAVHRLQAAAGMGAAPAQGPGGGAQVVVDGEVREHAPPLQHGHQAAPRPVMGRHAVDAPPVEQDLSRGDRALLVGQQAGDGADGGGLAGPVRAEQGDDASPRHPQRQAAQNRRGLPVRRFDAVELQRGGGRGRRAAVRGPLRGLFRRQLSRRARPSRRARSSPTPDPYARSPNCL